MRLSYRNFDGRIKSFDFFSSSRHSSSSSSSFLDLRRESLYVFFFFVCLLCMTSLFHLLNLFSIVVKLIDFFLFNLETKYNKDKQFS